MTAVPIEPRREIDAQNPWPGLDAFDENAAQFFNGREAESAELAHLVGQAPLTVLFGKSGLGKTSLLKAGLFPLLRAQGFFPIYVRLAVREREGDLIQQVATALFREATERAVEVAPRGFKGSLWERLHQRDFALWSSSNQPLAPLFVIDQFEEVFTLGAANPPAVERLRIDLADLVENRIPTAVVRALEAAPDSQTPVDLKSQRYKVLLSFREDFLPEIESWSRHLPSLMRNRFRLTAMKAKQAFEAVYKTGSAARLVDENTAREIVRFVGKMQTDDARAGAGPRSQGASLAEPDADEFARHEIEPALLSLVCSELNRRRQSAATPKPSIDAELLHGTGASIISDFYLRQVAKVPEATRRFIEEELLTEGGYRNSFPVDEALKRGALAEDLLHRLVDGRVLRIEQQLGTARVELTHDRLTDVVHQERYKRRERDRSARRRRWVRWSAAGGAVAAALIIFAAFTWVARNASEGERIEAEKQRAIAQQALVQVERERDEANRQRALADDARKAAEEARKRAEEEKARAEQQRELAEARQRQVVEEQEKTRVAAKRADDEADKAKRQNVVLGELFAPVRPGVLRIEAQRGGISTGFFVTRSGLAVTAGHVVKNVSDRLARVVNFEGKSFSATLVRLDTPRDLALLQISVAAPTPCLQFVDGLVKVRTPVAALSMSPTQDWVATTGTVVRLNVNLGPVFGIGKDGQGSTVGNDLIEVDLGATPGFSGAPVIDAAAKRVIGMGAYAQTGSESKRHFLIPASRIEAAFEQELAVSARRYGRCR